MTIVRLAVGGSPKAIAQSLAPMDNAPPPSILVSYAYIGEYLPMMDKIAIRDWVMDSGAFSAANSGKVIDLGQYTEFCKEREKHDERLTEVFALDVIGDPAASYKNAVEMQKAGVQVIPTHHFGSPRKELERLCAEFPKVALGGMVGKHPKVQLAWCREMFAVAWPKPFHAFGVLSATVLSELPFHSADSSSWEIGPLRYGNYKSFPGMSGARGGSRNLRVEIDKFLDLERRLKFRWRREMAQLDKMLDMK